MDRRHFLMGIGGATAALAGCNSSSDESDGPEGPFVDLEELPETEALLTQHRRTLDDRSFVSEEERMENPSDIGPLSRPHRRSAAVRPGRSSKRTTSPEISVATGSKRCGLPALRV